MIKTKFSCQETWEKVREQEAIGFDQTSNWMTKWEKTFEPIRKRDNAKPDQM